MPLAMDLDWEDPVCECHCSCTCTVDFEGDRCPMCNEACGPHPEGAIAPGNPTTRAEALSDRHERLHNRDGKVEGIDR